MFRFDPTYFSTDQRTNEAIISSPSLWYYTVSTVNLTTTAPRENFPAKIQTFLSFTLTFGPENH